MLKETLADQHNTEETRISLKEQGDLVNAKVVVMLRENDLYDEIIRQLSTMVQPDAIYFLTLQRGMEPSNDDKNRMQKVFDDCKAEGKATNNYTKLNSIYVDETVGKILRKEPTISQYIKDIGWEGLGFDQWDKILDQVGQTAISYGDKDMILVCGSLTYDLQALSFPYCRLAEHGIYIKQGEEEIFYFNLSPSEKRAETKDDFINIFKSVARPFEALNLHVYPGFQIGGTSGTQIITFNNMDDFLISDESKVKGLTKQSNINFENTAVFLDRHIFHKMEKEIYQYRAGVFVKHDINVVQDVTDPEKKKYIKKDDLTPNQIARGVAHKIASKINF